jgi:hypothetical protein
VIICVVFVKMEWTNEKTVELTEVYKAKTVLWDPKNPKYGTILFNRNSKSVAAVQTKFL